MPDWRQAFPKKINAVLKEKDHYAWDQGCSNERFCSRPYFALAGFDRSRALASEQKSPPEPCSLVLARHYLAPPRCSLVLARLVRTCRACSLVLTRLVNAARTCSLALARFASAARACSLALARLVNTARTCSLALAHFVCACRACSLVLARSAVLRCSSVLVSFGRSLVLARFILPVRVARSRSLVSFSPLAVARSRSLVTAWQLLFARSRSLASFAQ